MADDPNATYFYEAQGSITGFDTLSLAGSDKNLVETGWSIEQLKAFLQNKDGINFPSEDWVRAVDEAISHHLTDYNNPHQVTFDQVVSDFVGQVIGSVTSGTCPTAPPIFAYNAVCPLPLGDVFPAQYSSTNLYRMTEGGTLIDPATENQVIGIDTSSGHAGIPLFSGISNIVAPDWLTRRDLLVHTTIQQVPHTTIAYPFPFYLISETSASGDFGVTIPVQETFRSVYTASIFILPTVGAGSLIFSQPSDQANVMVVDLDDGTYTLSSDQVIGETFVYPCGMMRISFGFTTTQTPDNGVKIIHRNVGDTTTTRTGVANRPLFTLAQPCVSTAPLNQPIPTAIPNHMACSPLVFNLTKVGIPLVLNQMMMTLSLNLYPMLPGAVINDTVILSFGDLQVIRDQTFIYVTLLGIKIYATPIQKGRNVLTLSYSPTQIICKDRVSSRRTLNATYGPLRTDQVIAGPFSGYLESFVLYGVSDNDHVIEFLTNG